MRKRPDTEHLRNNFINSASTNVEETSVKHVVGSIPDVGEQSLKIDYNNYVSNITWPLDKDDILPSYAEGCLLKKPLSINLNEKEWNTIDRHVKTLGVTKDKWAKRALLKQLYIEQLAAFKAK